MKLSKRIIIGACSVTGAIAMVTNLTSCGYKKAQHNLSFLGSGYSVDGSTTSSFKFEAGKELKYVLSPIKGYKMPSTITCKFENEIKTAGVDYTFNDNIFTIKSAPKCDVSVNVLTTKVPYTITFIGESDSSYSVEETKRTYRVDDNLTYNFVNNTSEDLFSQSVHVYSDGVELSQSSFTFTPSNKNAEISKKAVLNLKAPAGNLTVSIQPKDKHVVYYKLTSATIDGEEESYKLADINGSVTLEISTNIQCHLPKTKDKVSVYKGGTLTSDFTYTYSSEQKATLTINNIDNYFAIYLTAESEMLEFELNDLNCYSVKGIYDSYKESKANVVIPATYNNKKVNRIKAGAFKGVEDINKVTVVGDNLEEIGDSAFEGCTGLANLSSILAVTKIGNSAFKGCKNLKTLTASSIEVIGSNAFEGCSTMQLGDYMFEINEIGDYAFKGCTNMSTCNATSYTSIPLVISGSNATKEGLKFNDLSKLGKGVCEGWETEGEKEQIIIFGGIWQNPTNIAPTYATAPIKEGDVETGYYKEIAGGTKTLGGSELGNITLAFTDLNLFSWDEISRISDAGLAKYIWSIGDIRRNDKGSKIQYRIIGFDHDIKANGSGFAGITFETVKLGYVDNIEQIVFTKTWPASYSNSNLRDTFNSTFINGEEIKAGGLRNNIKLVSKNAIRDKDHPTEVVQTDEWLFPLSYVEMGGEVTEYTQYKLEGSAYDYYKGSTTETRKKKRQKIDDTASYILRSPYLINQSYNNKYMVGVNLKGEFFPANATDDKGWAYSYAFCI